MSKHTPEPWTVDAEYDEEEGGVVLGYGICIPEIARMLHDQEWAASDDWETDLANAQRIVACVNACAGIENPADLRQQRDELLAALESLLDAHARNTLFSGAGHWEQARAAIVKARA